MKILRIFTLLFFASVLSAGAQMPAKRAMKKEKTEQGTGSLRESNPLLSGPTRMRNATNLDRTASGNAEATDKVEAPKPKTASPAKTSNRAASTAKSSGSEKASQPKTQPNLTGVSIREFPTAAVMPDDAAWRRDVYRTLDLTKEANACLYYPVTPTNGRQNLFVYLFRQILRGNIKAYEYTLDANEHFDEEHQLKGRKIMDTHNIYYENNDGKIRVNDADLPSEEVRLYFIKESVYYDQHTASFRTKVTAICPVMVSGTNDFGEDEMQRVPLFWVNYEEAAPYLAKLSLMGSSMNNASLVSADDYFTMNRYQGDIYKTTNLQDRIIAQYAEDEEAQVKERKRIEDELVQFESHVWGHDRDSVKNIFGNAVVDNEGAVITYDENGNLVDGQGRRVAFAVADSVSVASPDNLDPKTRMVPVLVNERGFAVNEKGEPLLNAEGLPIEITFAYPNPEGIDAPNINNEHTTKAAKAKSETKKSAAPSRRGSSSSSKASSSRKTKASKPAKTKSSSSKSSGSNGLSVRRERH